MDVKFSEQFHAAYAAGDLLQAQAILEAADDDPDVPRYFTLTWRGLLALEAHLLTGAEFLFRRALGCALSPRQVAQALVNLAVVAMRLDDHPPAWEARSMAIKGFTVALADDISEAAAEPIRLAIAQLRGVIGVTEVVDNMDDWINREKVRYEVLHEMRAVVEKLTRKP